MCYDIAWSSSSLYLNFMNLHFSTHYVQVHLKDDQGAWHKEGSKVFDK